MYQDHQVPGLGELQQRKVGPGIRGGDCVEGAGGAAGGVGCVASGVDVGSV